MAFFVGLSGGNLWVRGFPRSKDITLGNIKSQKKGEVL